MEKNYSYPIDYEWTKEQMEDVVNIWRMVELAYEKEIDREEFLVKYSKFKKVIPAIGEEKRWGNKFQALSNYSLYQVVKEAKTTTKKKIHLIER
ncbi:UPF0223 family protein [Carnobacterium pleistocenium]|uniref:UPF0223 family protein n=1 Tax=Carnobacterium pleistocenium TaxID=181073 RepID=UPI000551A082|nr:UPF0223 family protein [Carnobacterium pleistocenium]